MTATTAMLERLIAHPTVSRDSNRALIDEVASLLDDHGVKAVIIENDDGRKANLYATTGPDDHGGVMLSGHTDVVPVDGQDWTKPPFQAVTADGRIYGRGTADMKGFVASAITAFCAATKESLNSPLHLALSYDEEIGCVGVRSMIDMLKSAPVRPAMCIVGEPTGMAIATGHKGKTALHADCIGAEAHSALAPTAVNAIHLACDLVQEIRRLQDELAAHGARDEGYDIPYTTLHAGIISSGVALNIVPNHAAVKFEIRNLFEDDPTVILARLKAAIAPVVSAAQAKAPHADIQISITNTYPGLNTAHDDAVVEFVAGLTGGNDRIKVAFGTEGGLFSQDLGIPTVVCGPGFMDQGHKPDEFVSLEQLAACDAMLAQLVTRLKAGV
ncbi:MAG: acetylornithine deacetylase [Alphaproteobacteria bacterium]|nr:acetylornithine deacetylase [Alphaproteobacteria bacterium]